MARRLLAKITYVGMCPYCREPLHRSRRRGFKERVLLRLILVRPMRCHECEKRFLLPPTFSSDAVHESARKKVRRQDESAGTRSRSHANGR